MKLIIDLDTPDKTRAKRTLLLFLTYSKFIRICSWGAGKNKWIEKLIKPMY